MRSVGFTAIEAIRSDIAEYSAKLKEAKVSVKSFISNLEAHIQYWPRLFEDIEESGTTILKTYREGNYSRRRKKDNSILFYPKFDKRSVNLDIEKEKQKVNEVLENINLCQQELAKFLTNFEKEIVPMVRQKTESTSVTALGDKKSN
jgi:hypothetical protein